MTNNLGLEHLRHCPTEAKRMNLIGKSHLHQLTLNWNVHTVGDTNELEKDDIILHDMVLHSNIKGLQINGFGGVKFSSSANLLKNLVQLNLLNSSRLQFSNSHCCMSNASAWIICLAWSA